MSEATSMEENQNRDDHCSAERFCELDGSVTVVMRERGWLVDSGEKVGGRIDVIKGEDAVDGERVGGNFTVKKLGEVAVEGTIGTTEDFVSKLEIGNEDPCVEWDNSLQSNIRRDEMMGRLRFYYTLFFFFKEKQNSSVRLVIFN